MTTSDGKTLRLYFPSTSVLSDCKSKLEKTLTPVDGYGVEIAWTAYKFVSGKLNGKTRSKVDSTCVYKKY